MGRAVSEAEELYDITLRTGETPEAFRERCALRWSSTTLDVFDRVIEIANREFERAMQCTVIIPRDQDVLGTGVLRGTVLVRVPHYISVTIGFVDTDLLRWADDGGRV